MISKRRRRDWLVVRRRRMMRKSARRFGLVSPCWSVVRSSGGYGVDTSTKVVFESSRAAAGDDDHRSRSRGSLVPRRIMVLVLMLTDPSLRHVLDGRAGRARRCHRRRNCQVDHRGIAAVTLLLTCRRSRGRPAAAPSSGELRRVCCVGRSWRMRSGVSRDAAFKLPSLVGRTRWRVEGCGVGLLRSRSGRGAGSARKRARRRVSAARPWS